MVTRGWAAGDARVRVLTDSDLPAARAMLERRPVVDVFVASRIASAGLSEWRLGAQVWGHEQDGELLAMCYAGANIWPVCAGPASIDAFAAYARRRHRRCASIVGLAAEVLPFWDQLKRAWGPARELRDDQPLMVLDRPPPVAPDPEVRLVHPSELDILLPAAVAMFTEEIGVPPESVDLYRARVAELISAQALLRPDRERAGSVQGRGRRGDHGGLPDPGRLGRARHARPGDRHLRHGGRRSGGPA